MVRAWVPVPMPLVAPTVTLNVPLWVGVPEIRPRRIQGDAPLGSVPLTSEKPSKVSGCELEAEGLAPRAAGRVGTSRNTGTVGAMVIARALVPVPPGLVARTVTLKVPLWVRVPR